MCSAGAGAALDFNALDGVLPGCCDGGATDDDGAVAKSRYDDADLGYGSGRGMRWFE